MEKRERYSATFLDKKVDELIQFVEDNPDGAVEDEVIYQWIA